MSKIIASKYEIIEKIGSGGGGNVYLAHHLGLNKRVVLKADKRKITTPETLLRREVDILKKLSHTYIPQVYDFFIEEGTVYTVIDYVDGESLDKPLKRGQHFSQPQVIKWAKQLLEALCYLHNPEHKDPPEGFVHSDIKPANIMCRANGDICLIDFNIALALGEINSIGRSAGYASPEHYGLDFSTESPVPSEINTEGHPGKQDQEASDSTVCQDTASTMLENARSGSTSGSSKTKVIMPDVRSDIYSLGATLYHLLSGQRPAKNAKEVVPLSEEEFSPQVIKIISRAMEPNPDLRYQTAKEMLAAFTQLRENDPRVRRLKKNRKIAVSLFTVMLAAGIAASFTGLKRMQTAEQWLKLAEYSQDALAKGDTEAAIDYALQALPGQPGILEPKRKAEAQKALTEALGVYDLSDGYKTHETVELPSAPLYMTISPDGRRACCIYAHGAAIVDTDTAGVIADLPAEGSALTEAEFLDNNRLIYGGSDGIQVYDMENSSVLWTGKPATAICVSGDGKRAAAIYKDEESATIYDTSDGQVLYTIDLEGRHQQVTVNDSFANPNDNLLAFNDTGTLLGVSFSDGSLQIYDVDDPQKDMLLFDKDSGYTHFEGGFYGQYFAFSASQKGKSVFAVIDTESAAQTGGFESESAFSVKTDENGIYLQTDNVLVKIHPDTGEQTALVTTAENIRSFAVSDQHTLITSQDGFRFFDRNANLISHFEKEYESALVQIAEGTALVGSSDSPVVRILKYESHPDTELFSYDPSYQHSEARLSADRQYVMLFSYEQFRIYRMDGELAAEVKLPDKEQIYDQQYIRDENGSSLEVIYNDGLVRNYDGQTGELRREESKEKPDLTLYEEFYTDEFRIESPLHGIPAVYDRKTGRQKGELEKDDYLTYVTQAGEYIITQYVTADGYCYGLLLNENCEVLAKLPYLCDVIEDHLIFDYPTGNMRESRIYDIEELLAIAQNKNGGEK